jgi:hypothetical protein
MSEITPTSASPSVPLPPFNGTTSQAIADRLRLLEHLDKISSYVALCRAAGVVFDTVTTEKGYQERLARWINNATNQYELLGEHNYGLLAQSLIRDFPFLTSYIGVPLFNILVSPMYHSIATLLNCHSRGTGRDLVIKKMKGKYKVYRASMREKDRGYIGIMHVYYDQGTDSITTREQYTKSDHEKWDVPGTIYPISSDTFIILTVDTVDSTIKITYVNERGFDNDGNVAFFIGWAADTDRRRFFAAPMYAKRTSDDDETQEYKKIDEFPADIKECLERRLSPETPYGRFVYTPER